MGNEKFENQAKIKFIVKTRKTEIFGIRKLPFFLR